MVRAKKPLPPGYFFVTVIVMAFAHIYFPIVVWLEGPIRYVGVAIVVAAAGFIFWAAGLFGKAGTALKPYQESSALVTEGPYRWTRNPMYLGMVAVLIGLGVLFGSLSPFLVIPTFALLMQEKFIKVEEEMLERTFGEEYREFRSRVRRWI